MSSIKHLLVGLALKQVRAKSLYFSFINLGDTSNKMLIYYHNPLILLPCLRKSFDFKKSQYYYGQ